MNDRILTREALKFAVSPNIRELLTVPSRIQPAVVGTPAPAPAPPPPEAAAPATPPPPAPAPLAPAPNVFNQLPYPQAGDRIRAEDFRRLSQALQHISDAYALNSALLGRSFGEARMLLTSQQYLIERVLTVFGNAVQDLGDSSLDSRQVLSATPSVLGTRNVIVILSEAVDNRRIMPPLERITYQAAVDRVRASLGDTIPGTAPIAAPNFVGQTLGNAALSIGQG